MIELKPKIENHFVCPECKTEGPVINDVLIQPICELADCTCRNCGLEFFQTFPIGHLVDENLSIEKYTNRLYVNSQKASWLSDIVQTIYRSPWNGDFTIEKKIFINCKSVVILNTLDFLYGHVLLKLYNAQYHLDNQKHLGLIVIIPRSFEWLIPQGCAEAWIVDLKLSELAHKHESIQKFISKEFERFDKVYLSKAYSHPDFTTVDITRLTGIKPFDLKYFNELRPTVTFILREDRWWYSNVFDYLFYRVCRKLTVLKWGNRILSLRQNRLVLKAIKHIREELPGADLIIAGLGKTGSIGLAKDNRTNDVNPTLEKRWCNAYAKSHVVVGVHGSNMLLPTSLAAGCVEILPNDRYGNMVQDLSVRYNDRRQLFFYRFVDQYASPKSVAAKVVSIIKDYEMFDKNMRCNLYSIKSASDAKNSNFQKEKF